MDAGVDPRGAKRPLELLGISRREEGAYRALLERHTATVAELAAELKTTRAVARRLLADLEKAGLATHTPKVPRVYVAAPPEFAVAALVKQRQAMLERVRVAIPDLEAHSARASRVAGQTPVTELIEGRAQLAAVLGQLYESFRSEAMCFQRAPLLAPMVRPPRRIPAGASVRTISDDSLLDMPGALERIREDLVSGEQTRTQPTLPFKMMIFDRRAAIIALDGVETASASALLVHGGPLVHALCGVFECAWERATPIRFANTCAPRPARRQGDVREFVDALVPLLSAGLNDKAIAAELGISSATLNRRMVELMRMTGTRSRFQLGWHLALDGAGKPRLAPPRG